MIDVDYSKISVTAKLVAFYRKFSDIPFAVDVADAIHAEAAFKNIVSKLDLQNNPDAASMPDEGKLYAPLLEARYKSIVQLLLNSGCKQILELASGFSLRGLAMTRDAGYVYVESDLHGVNEEKKKLVSDLRSKYALADLGNHHLITANALALDELESSLHFFDREKPLAIVSEGLIQYLSEDERKAVAVNVYTILQRFSGGIWITPDFITRQAADNVSENAKRFRMAIANVTERELYASAFETEDALNDFINDVGFSGEWLNQLDIVQELTSIPTLGIHAEMVEKHLKPRMRVWKLIPNSP